MVDIQHAALAALEKDAFALGDRLPKHCPSVAHQRCQLLAVGDILFADGVKVHRLSPI